IVSPRASWPSPRPRAGDTPRRSSAASTSAAAGTSTPPALRVGAGRSAHAKGVTRWCVRLEDVHRSSGGPRGSDRGAWTSARRLDRRGRRVHVRSLDSRDQGDSAWAAAGCLLVREERGKDHAEQVAHDLLVPRAKVPAKRVEDLGLHEQLEVAPLERLADLGEREWLRSADRLWLSRCDGGGSGWRCDALTRTLLQQLAHRRRDCPLRHLLHHRDGLTTNGAAHAPDAARTRARRRFGLDRLGANA